MAFQLVADGISGWMTNDSLQFVGLALVSLLLLPLVERCGTIYFSWKAFLLCDCARFIHPMCSLLSSVVLVVNGA